MSESCLDAGQMEDESQFGSEISDETYDRWMRYGAALIAEAHREINEQIANPSRGTIPAPKPFPPPSV